MLGCQDIFEPVWLGLQEYSRLLGKVRGVVVENQPDGELAGIVLVQIIEQGNELPAAVAGECPVDRRK